MIHALWTERELAAAYSTPEAIREHPAMRRFIRWIAGKPAEFWVPTDGPRHRRR